MKALAASLPRFTRRDMEEFMDQDPVYGPRLRGLQRAGDIAVVASVPGALGSAMYTYRQMGRLGLVSGLAAGFGAITFGLAADSVRLSCFQRRTFLRD